LRATDATFNAWNWFWLISKPRFSES